MKATLRRHHHTLMMTPLGVAELTLVSDIKIMTTRKLPAVLLAAALLSTPFAVTAHAATRAHTAMTRHHVAKPVHASSRATARAAAGADHSADSLNAQSLARSQGQ